MITSEVYYNNLTVAQNCNNNKMDNEEIGTPIQEFYRGTSILVTGGTGFLGSVLIEKIMRTCPHFDKMYLIIRPKKGKDQKQRLKELFDNEIFARVNPKIFEKVSIISGDCSKPMLGLSADDQKVLQENVSIVFHSAATVKFDEPLQLAVAINIIATRDLLVLAKGMSNLKAFIHVSTAYSNCHLKKIDETFYTPSIEGNKLITLSECLEGSQLERLTPVLLKDVPNTYVYTKAVAEDLIQKYSKGIPTAIVRPSIIIAANKEPIPGWIDSLYGPSGVVVASTTGIMRTMQCDPEKKADVVPVDMVVNTIMTAAWNLENRRNKDSMEDPQIYNFVSSARNPITWFQFFSLCYKFWPHTILAVWYPFITIQKSLIKSKILTFLWHFLPALLIDTIAQAFGKQPGLLKISQKIEKLCSLISYFSTRQWDFNDKNTLEMWETLDNRDKELFPFDVAELKWEEYFVHYMLGARKFLLKDDPSSIPAGSVRVRRLFFLHYTVMTILGLLLLYVLWYCFGSLIMSYSGLVNNSLTESLSSTYVEKIHSAMPVS